MQRLLILDPSLITVLSHNYSEATGLVREARDLRIPTEFLCHLRADQAVRDVPARPFFHQHGYGHLPDSRPAADFLAISYSNQVTWQDLQTLTETVAKGDFVFFPTVTCNNVLAICQWLSSWDPAGAPRFGMCPHVSARCHGRQANEFRCP